MEEARRTTAQEQPKKSQIRRAERGIVAGYIHELSERHGDRHAAEAQTQLSTEAGEAD
jgi:hypothetical protein